MNKSKLFILDYLINNFNSNHRSTIFLCGSQSWSHEISYNFLSLFSESMQKCWFGNIDSPKLKNISNLQIVNLINKQKIIGTDIDLMVIDGWSGLSPNLLGMASGTLKGGAVLLILLPEIDKLVRYKDPFLKNFKSKRPYNYEMGNGFLKRLCTRFLLDYEKTNLIRVISECENFNFQNELFEYSKFLKLNKKLEKNYEYLPLNNDQKKVIRAMLDLYASDKGIICINADRGRGKTVSLGMGVCEFKKNPEINVIITSPNKSNLKNFFSVLDKKSKKCFFYPVDKIISMHQKDLNYYKKTILIVDEAAGFPLPILKKLTNIFSKIIFSSTVEGYEGSGRGFVINFKKFLFEIDPAFLSLSLHKPLRWSDNDPMESFFKDLLIMNNKSNNFHELFDIRNENINIELIDTKSLLIDESLLTEIYSLLVLSHYQTRPDDLRMILDAPYIHLWVVSLGDLSKKNIIAVLLVTEEGGFKKNKHKLYLDQILLGLKRPRGNLLAQLMTNQTGDENWSKHSSLRVMRIAVHESYRKQGIATQLIEKLKNYAVSKDYSFLSVTFGFSKDIYDFWKKQDMSLINIGMHIDKSSGSRNIMLARGLDQNTTDIINRQNQIMESNLIFYKKNYFLEIKKEEWKNIHNPSFKYDININRDINIINRFIANELTFENAFPSICRFYKNINENKSQLNKKLSVVKSSIEYAPRWSIISNMHQLSGRKSVIETIKNELMPITNK